MGQSEEMRLVVLDNGDTFQVGKLSPRRAIRMAIRIGKFLGPAIGGAVAEMGAPAEGQAPSLANTRLDFGRGLAALFDRLSPSDFEEITNEFLFNAIDRDGRSVVQNFDSIFEGRPFAVLQLLRAAMEHTYGDFSKLAAQAVASYSGAVTGSGSRSPTASPMNGPSGA